MRIYQYHDGYCYNSDSLFLCSFALPFLQAKSYRTQSLLDIGAGSGILGLLCARDVKNLSITLWEKEKKMVRLCRRNAKENRIMAKIILGDFLENDLDCNLDDKKFDFAISNPPFYRVGVIKPKNPLISKARGSENLPFIALIKRLKSLLKPKGGFLFCYDAKSVFMVLNTLENEGFRASVLRFVYPNNKKNATSFMCFAKRNSKDETKVLPPLFTHSGLKFSKETRDIYSKLNIQSVKIFS